MLSGGKWKDEGEEQSGFYFGGPGRGEACSAEDKAKKKKKNTRRPFVIHTKDRLKPKERQRGKKNQDQSKEDSSPERANIYQDYRIHHSVCLSRIWRSAEQKPEAGPREVVVREDKRGILSKVNKVSQCGLWVASDTYPA